MLNAAKYSAVEVLRDGRRVEIRALRTDDRADLLDAVERTGAQSLYRRFFGAKRDLSEKEIEFFLNIDFANHVALVATVEEGSRSRNRRRRTLHHGATSIGGSRFCRCRRIPEG